MSTPASIRILMVEDFSVMARLLRTFLRQLGFHDIDHVSDGPAALSNLRARSYGLLIPDWNLRPMSGFELVRRVRADQRFKETRVLMLMPAPGNLVEVAAGANGYLSKPFDVAALGNALTRIFSN